jgi:hypothetical protein
MRSHQLLITNRLNELGMRHASGKFVTEDEWNNTDDAIKQLAAV